MKSQMGVSVKKFLRNFVKCGVTGWCIEILFTAINSLRCRDMKLSGQTSLWMFPIYGSAALLQPLFRLMRGKPPLLRGIAYALFIFTGEYISGSLLSGKEVCPWNYDRSGWHVKKVIRLDYMKYWVVVGLLFEKILVLPWDKTS